ncbi:unnamed protein product, partial [Owenia fusiformis]
NDDNNLGLNDYNGILPDGVYGSDTRYDFCCRNDPYDESTKWPIELPNAKPFYLIKNSENCQAVAGMEFTEDTVRFSGGSQNGSAPYDPSLPERTTLSLCYYYPIQYGCNNVVTLDSSSPSVTIETPNYPSAYNPNQECNWLIKAPEGSRVNIFFEAFDIDGDELLNHTHVCEDYVEIRKSMLGQPGSRICGEQVRRSWMTEESTTWLKFRSDREVEKTGFRAVITYNTDDDIVPFYNPSTKGASYRGEMAYTQGYRPCKNWLSVKHCDVNPLDPEYFEKGLGDHFFCRNPNNLYRPWCYIDDFCTQDFCDIPNLGVCHDIYNDCSEQIANNSDTCSTVDGLRGCKKSCDYCSLRVEEKETIEAPSVVDPYAFTDSTLKPPYNDGDVIRYQCSFNGSTVFGFDDKMALTDGTWS